MALFESEKEMVIACRDTVRDLAKKVKHTPHRPCATVYFNPYNGEAAITNAMQFKSALRMVGEMALCGGWVAIVENNEVFEEYNFLHIYDVYQRGYKYNG